MTRPIAHAEFADGEMCPGFEYACGQFVVAGDGEPVYGVWFIPRSESDLPAVPADAGR